MNPGGFHEQTAKCSRIINLHKLNLFWNKIQKVEKEKSRNTVHAIRSRSPSCYDVVVSSQNLLFVANVTPFFPNYFIPPQFAPAVSSLSFSRVLGCSLRACELRSLSRRWFFFPAASNRVLFFSFGTWNYCSLGLYRGRSVLPIGLKLPALPPPSSVSRADRNSPIYSITCRRESTKLNWPKNKKKTIIKSHGRRALRLFLNVRSSVPIILRETFARSQRYSYTTDVNYKRTCNVDVSHE